MIPGVEVPKAEVDAAGVAPKAVVPVVAPGVVPKLNPVISSNRIWCKPVMARSGLQKAFKPFGAAFPSLASIVAFIGGCWSADSRSRRSRRS